MKTRAFTLGGGGEREEGKGRERKGRGRRPTRSYHLFSRGRDHLLHSPERSECPGNSRGVEHLEAARAISSRLIWLAALLSVCTNTESRRFLLLDLFSNRRKVQRLTGKERGIVDIRGGRGGVRRYEPAEVALATTVNCCWVETGFRPEHLQQIFLE